MSPTQATIEPTSPSPAPDAVPPSDTLSPSANGENETALARLADEGVPSPPQAPTGETPEAPPPATSAQTLSLEERVRRLEAALAALPEKRDPAPPLASPVPTTPLASTAVLLDVGKRLLGAAAQVVPPALASVPSIAHPTNRGSVRWLLWETWAEASAIVRMFLDRRYRLPWSARVLPLILLAAILVPKKYWVPGAQLPILGDWLLSKAINLILAFLLFKWLGHEARRYRQTVPDLPPSLRL